MRVINSKLAAIGMAAIVFASCSDSTNDSSVGPSPLPSVTPEITKVTLEQTDAAQLASSVTNYKHTTNKARTRAIDASLFKGLTSMPSIPSKDGAKRLNNPADLDGGTWQTTGSDKKFDFSGKAINNATIFVSGGTTLAYNQLGTGNTIYVLEAGSLEYTGNSAAIPAGNTVVVSKGSFTSTNDITIDGDLYSTAALGQITKDYEPTQNITINGNVFLSGYTNKKSEYVYASLRAKTLTINAGAKVNTEDRVTFTDDVILNGALHVGNTAEVTNMTINNGGDFSSDASVKVKKSLTMNAGSKMSVIYLNVTDNEYTTDGTEKHKKKAGTSTLTLNGNAQITIGDHGVMNINRLFTDNTAGQIVLGGGNNNVAVVKVDQFVYNGKDNILCFSTPNDLKQLFLLQFIECYQNGAISDANKIDYEEGDNYDCDATWRDYVDATGGGALEAIKNHGWQLKEVWEVSKQPTLDLISTVNAPVDGQSATCIQLHNGKIYISYHTRDNAFGGNIEVAQLEDKKVSILQNVKQSIPTLDFNHLSIINNRLFLAGSGAGKQDQKIGGATLSYVGFDSNGNLNIADGLQTIALDNTVAGDANCVVEHGGNIVVADTKGYDILDPITLNDTPVPADGKAKFVVKNGSNLIGLNYKSAIAAGNDPVQGEIQVFNNSDLSSTSSRFDVGTIAPNNGKNMVAVDNNGRIYVCKSAKGLACYNADGTKAWETDYTTPKASKGNQSVDNVQGYINGVAVDDNYVYVAAGSYGLVVLSKENGKRITNRRIGKGAAKNYSANYVTVKDGLIYVAYGQGRVQIFQLKQPATQS